MNTPKFKCVIVDHDDTAVDSSRHIHHACHVEIMKALRPNITPVDLGEWFVINSRSGGLKAYFQSLKFTEEELRQEHARWAEFTQKSPIPPFYPGFVELMERLQKSGSLIVVSSHGPADQIYRHYFSTKRVVPNAVYGWDPDPSKNKPSPWLIEDVVRIFGLASPAECCVIDDMRPGIDMAEAAGAYPICAAWGPAFGLSKEIREFMTAHCKTRCKSVADLEQFLFK
jgi:HAD superfamily hydrolase (TIGR01509 family)